MTASPGPRLAALRALAAAALPAYEEACRLRGCIDADTHARLVEWRNVVADPALFLSLLDAVESANRAWAAAQSRVEEVEAMHHALAARLAGAEGVVDEARKMSVPMVYGSSQDWEDQAQARMTRLHQAVAAYDVAGGEGRGT